jgi:predicted GIY-YIG superfamily endonuclease
MFLKQNKKRKDFVVYGLFCPVDNIVRYIGITYRPKERLKEHIRQSRTGGTHKKHWLNKLINIENKIPEIKILAKNLTLSQAKNKEKLLIKQYRKKFGKKIVNATNGGDGVFGFIPSKKQISKVSKKIDQYNFSGKLIKEHISIQSAHRETKTARSDIWRVCNGINLCTNGKDIWRYSGDKFNKFPLPSPKRKIIQYSLDGKQIECFLNIKQASQLTKIKYGIICKCVNGENKSGAGFIWKREGDGFSYSNKRKIKVSQYCVNNKFISEYESFSEASEKTNICLSSIIKCCKGQRNHAGGFKWRYA